MSKDYWQQQAEKLKEVINQEKNLSLDEMLAFLQKDQNEMLSQLSSESLASDFIRHKEPKEFRTVVSVLQSLLRSEKVCA